MTKVEEKLRRQSIREQFGVGGVGGNHDKHQTGYPVFPAG